MRMSGPFMNEKVFEKDEDTSIILFENLHKLFSKEAKVYVQNHLFQWLSPKLTPALLDSENPFIHTFCIILRNKSTRNVCKIASFNDRSIHLPYFVSSASSNSEISMIREKKIFKNITAIEKILNDTKLFIQNMIMLKC